MRLASAPRALNALASNDDRARAPITAASTNTITMPATVGTTSGVNSSPTPTCSAVAARVAGPPQGRMFIVPAAMAVVHVRISGSIPSR